jgi:hypothetical protein
LSEGSAGAERPPGRGPPGRPGIGCPGRTGTCCPGRPGAPARDGNLDGAAPGRALTVVGRSGAGGFTRAPGGKGFQFGLGADFAEEVGCIVAPCRADTAGRAAAGGGVAAGFAPAGADGGICLGDTGAVTAGRAAVFGGAAAGAAAGFTGAGGGTAGAAGFAAITAGAGAGFVTAGVAGTGAATGGTGADTAGA